MAARRRGNGFNGSDRANVTVAVVGAVGTVVAAVVAGVVALVGGDPEPSAGGPTASAAPTGGSRPDCPGPSAALPPGSAVDITGPHDGDRVGFGTAEVTGTATLARGHHLWFFVWGPTSRQLYIMGTGRRAVENGLWTFPQLELGDGSDDDRGKAFCLTAMVVDTAEDTFLERVAIARRATGSALEKSEIPKTGLARSVVVYLA